MGVKKEFLSEKSLRTFFGSLLSRREIKMIINGCRKKSYTRRITERTSRFSDTNVLTFEVVSTWYRHNFTTYDEEWMVYMFSDNEAYHKILKKHVVNFYNVFILRYELRKDNKDFIKPSDFVMESFGLV